MSAHMTGTIDLAHRIMVQLHLQPGEWHPATHLAATLNTSVDAVVQACNDLVQRQMVEHREIDGQAQFGRWVHSTSMVVRGGDE